MLYRLYRFFSINYARKNIFTPYFSIYIFSILGGTSGTKSDSVEIRGETAYLLCFFKRYKRYKHCLGGTNPPPPPSP